MSHSFAVKQAPGLTIPARLALIVVLAVGLSLPLVPAPTVRAAAVLYVKWDAAGANDGSSWTDAYTGLQSALTAATAGDEIWVAEGTYTPGTDRTATFQLESGVGVYGGFAGMETARGERDWAAHPTVLSGDVGTPGDDSDNVYHVVTGSGTDASAVLDGFVVSGGNADGTDLHSIGGGMHTVGGSPSLTNVTFSGNSAVGGGGMCNYGSSSPTLTNVTFSGNSASLGGGMANTTGSPSLTNVTFSGNSASHDGGGMDNWKSNPSLTNVTFSGNSASHDAGGMANWESNPSLTDVTFSGNSASNRGGGMCNWDSSNPTLTNCILWGNTAPSSPQIYNSAGSTPTITYSDVQGGHAGTGNIDADPLFVDADGADDVAGTLDDNLRLRAGSPAIDAGDNTAPGLSGITTDLSGSPRFADIASVLDTGSGTAPIVDMGAYEASVLYVDQDATGGANDGSSWTDAFTDLQSALSTAGIGIEIWVAEGTYTPGTLRTDTFTLKNGVALYGGFAGTETARGERDWAAHPTVLSGDVGTPGDNSDNAYHVVTGSGTDATAVLDGFTVSGGNANGTDPHNGGGGMYNIGDSPTLTNVTFSGNSASWGGGMFNLDSSPRLTNVTFSGNSASSGGGMFNRGGSNPRLTNVTFSGNSASSDGGGMFNLHDTSPRLTNVTFSGNSASNRGGGVFNYLSSSPTLTNCILWGNTAPQGAQIDNSSSTATVTYSDVQDGYPGAGNIDADPRFVDADGPDDVVGTLDDNLRLRAGSPAIDAGDDTAVPAGVTTDLDGNPRITGAAVDMGAYEAGDLYHVFLPLVSRNYVVAPDLIVERVTATGNDVQVVVKNQGNAPVTDEFWVEAYVDPHPAPSAVNQLWYDLCDQGMFWGIVSPALPLAPGEAITLTYGDGYYWPSVSRFDEALPAGTPVYAQVDAYNAATTYGAVRESHEILGGEYNNVAGPVYSAGAASRRGQPGAETRATGQPRDVSRTNLPPLPGQ